MGLPPTWGPSPPPGLTPVPVPRPQPRVYTAGFPGSEINHKTPWWQMTKSRPERKSPLPGAAERGNGRPGTRTQVACLLALALHGTAPGGSRGDVSRPASPRRLLALVEAAPTLPRRKNKPEPKTKSQRTASSLTIGRVGFVAACPKCRPRRDSLQTEM